MADTNTAATAADAARFLKLLDPTVTKFEFRTFDDDKDREDDNLTRTFYGTLAQYAAELQRFNHKGAGVFVTIMRPMASAARLKISFGSAPCLLTLTALRWLR